jgi:hypothetical protein
MERPLPISARAIPAGLKGLFQLEPPGWTRLEPQSVSGDPTPGLEARVHDPLWLLARQWQLGEFHGEDAGTPVAVHVSSTTSPIVAWQPGDPGPPGHPARVWEDGTFLEPPVEREPTTAAGPGLRQRAEAGAQFLAVLGDSGIVDAGVAGAIVSECPLPAVAGDPFDTSAPALQRLLAGRIPDGEAIAQRLEPGLAQAPPALPSWFAGVADQAAILQAAQEWLAWYRAGVSPQPDPSADSWVTDRLEYRFSIAVAGSGGGQTVLRAPQFGGGKVDWYVFEHDPQAAPLQVATGGGAPQPQPREQTLLATPLRFAGMPAPRYWQFEDGQVNLGALEAQPHDLARLLLVEFAMVFGNDWLVVPLDVPFGSLTTIDTVDYTTTFNERLTVAQANDAGRPGTFSLFRISPSLDGLLVPPSAMGALEGAALEDVLFLRDETANLAWAVERIVQGPSGDPRNRAAEPQPEPFQPGTEPGADLDYLIETQLPDNWIPFVPVATGDWTRVLRKGAIVKKGADVEPVGILLQPGAQLDVQDEEIPREGRRVQRIPVLARRVDGTYDRWIARRASVGRGEGASGLAFDSAIARTTQ